MGKLLFGGALALLLVGCDKPPPEKQSQNPAPSADAAALSAQEAVKAQAEHQEPGNPEPAGAADIQVAAVPGSVRLVVVTEAEPLGSEKAELKALEASLKKAGLQVNSAPSEAAEALYLASLLGSPESAPPLVSAWGRFETVVLLKMALPEGKEAGSRVSRGRSHLVVLHPPEKVPALSTLYAEEGAAYLDGAKLGVHVATHLTLRKAQP